MPRRGRLTPLAGAAGCLRANRTGCTPVSGVDAPSAIAISPDGTSLYVTSTAGTLTSFQRDITAGTLTQLPPGTGCLSDAPIADCTAIGGLARASAVVVSPDGADRARSGHRRRRGARRSGAIRPPARSRASRASRATPRPPGCVLSTLLHGPRALALRPDSRVVWVASSRADSIVTLQFDPATSGLTPTAGDGRLRAAAGRRSTAAPRARSTIRAASPSAPTASHLFAVSALSDGIAVLGPQVAPNCLAHPRRDRGQHGALGRARVLGSERRQGRAHDREAAAARQAGRARAGHGQPSSTRRSRATRAPTRSRSARRDGMDVSADGTATVRVTLPPKAPKVRIRTARARLLQRLEDPRARGMPRDRDRPLPDRDAPRRQGQACGLRLRAPGAPHDGPHRRSAPMA